MCDAVLLSHLLLSTLRPEPRDSPGAAGIVRTNAWRSEITNSMIEMHECLKESIIYRSEFRVRVRLRFGRRSYIAGRLE